MRRLRDTALAMVRVAQIAFLYFLRISFLFTVWARAATGQHWNLPSIDQGGKRRHANAAFTIKVPHEKIYSYWTSPQNHPKSKST